MQISIGFIYPLSVAHSITYCLQLYFYLIFTANASLFTVEGGNFLYELVNTGRTMGNFLLALFVYIYINVKKQKSNSIWTEINMDKTNVYFNAFKKQIA